MGTAGKIYIIWKVLHSSQNEIALYTPLTFGKRRAPIAALQTNPEVNDGFILQRNPPLSIRAMGIDGISKAAWFDGFDVKGQGAQQLTRRDAIPRPCEQSRDTGYSSADYCNAVNTAD